MLYKILALVCAVGWVTTSTLCYIQAGRTQRAVVELCHTLRGLDSMGIPAPQPTTPTQDPLPDYDG